MAEKKQAPLNTLLTIYFYHTRLTRESYEEWKEYKFPGHILYGLPLLENYGIHSVMHKCKYFSSRLKLMFYATKEILFCKEKYRRALCHLFPGDRTRHLPPCTGTVPQAHRHLASHGRRHQPQTLARTNLPPFLQRHRPNVPVQPEADSGLAENPESSVPQTETDTLGTGPSFLRPSAGRNARPEARRIYLHRQREPGRGHPAPGILPQPMRNWICTLPSHAATSTIKRYIDRYSVPDSIHIHYTDGVIPYELGKLVARKSCIVICCLDFPYTVGLTTLVEAFALGIPVICSRNPNFEIDIDKEEIGITVEYNDVQGWIDAIRYIADHPEEARRMGENARKLAEERFNLEIFSREIAESLLEISNISSKNRTFA